MSRQTFLIHLHAIDVARNAIGDYQVMRLNGDMKERPIATRLENSPQQIYCPLSGVFGVDFTMVDRQLQNSPYKRDGHRVMPTRGT